MTVLEILQPRLDPIQLKGFKKGFFDESEKKLFAYTILSTKDEDFDWLNRQYLSNRGYSRASSPENEEKHKIYNPNGTYSYKGVEQLVEEEIFKFVSLRFYGIQFQNEWYILDDLSFSEKNNQEFEKEIDQMYGVNTFNFSTFQPIPEYESQLDFEELVEMLSEKLGRKLDRLKDSVIIRKNIAQIPNNEQPRKLEKQPADLREFIGQPWLVAHIKQEEKSRINRAFENYFNESVLLPFLKKVRIERFNEFVSLHTLYSPNHLPLIYPHSKEFVIAIVKAINREGKSWLHYFVYQSSTKQMFEWTKPNVHEVPGHHAEWILEDIKDFSSWGDELIFTNHPSQWKMLLFGMNMFLKKRTVSIYT